MSEYENVAYRIFHDLWLVEIPEMYSYGMDYISEVGVPTTGDRKLDNAMAAQPLRRYMTIAAMVMFHDEGADVTIMEPTNSVEIYRLLVTHMQNWQMIIQNHLNVQAPPAEDFMQMDAFAKAIHPLSTWYNEGQTADNQLDNRMRTIRGRHSAMLMGSAARARRVDNTNNPNSQQRYADELAKRSWS